MASKKKERPNQLPLIGALSALAVYFGWKLLSNRPPSADGNSDASDTPSADQNSDASDTPSADGNSDASDTQSNRSSNVDEAGNRPANNTILESPQEKDDRDESGSVPFKEEQDAQFLSTSEGLNSVCNHISTDDWKHQYSATSSDSPVSLPWSSHSSSLLNSELVEGDDIALLGSTPRSDVAKCADNGGTLGHSEIRSEADAYLNPGLDRGLSSSSLSSISVESSIKNPHDSEGVINASTDLRLHAYDEYLSDPCLSPAMRSQVLRAKSIVERLHKP